MNRPPAPAPGPTNFAASAGAGFFPGTIVTVSEATNQVKPCPFTMTLSPNVALDFLSGINSPTTTESPVKGGPPNPTAVSKSSPPSRLCRATVTESTGMGA